LFQNKKIMKQKYSALENREIANPTNLKWKGVIVKYGDYLTCHTQTREGICGKAQQSTCETHVVQSLWRVLIKSDGTGHYVPQLAEMVYERNMHLEMNQHINLKGFIVSV
jgi:hypothetical protein